MLLLISASVADGGWVYTHTKGGESDAKAQKATWPALCRSGRFQSPIDIDTSKVSETPGLSGGVVPAFSGAHLIANNTGHNFQISFEKGEKPAHTMLRGETFDFVQAHFHVPSEHTIDGERAAMEGHFVHTLRGSDPPVLAVVGIFFSETNECNPILELFWDAFKIDGIGAAKQPTDPVDLTALLTPAYADGYYHYTGSLTTPPCTEGVDWNLAKGALGVCGAQLQRLKTGLAATQNGVDINNRAINPLNLRDVTTTSTQLAAAFAVTPTSLLGPSDSGSKAVASSRTVWFLPALGLVIAAGGFLAYRRGGSSRKGSRSDPLLEAREVDTRYAHA